MLFITAILNLRIRETLGRGDKIDNETFITNDRDRVRSLVVPDALPVIGLLEYDAILSSGTTYYSVRKQPDDLEPQKELLNNLEKLSGFLNTIWLFQDNCVNSEMGFLFYQRNGTLTIDSNFHAVLYSKADGNHETLELSRKQLQEIRRFNRLGIDAGDLFARPTTMLSKDTSRIERTFYLLQAARVTSDLGIKISSYCSAFEALFSSSPQELAHQLSERVAFFIGIDGDDRLSKYRSMKEAYAIRSQIVHGSALKTSTINRLPDVSKNCDNMLRTCMKRVFSDPAMLKKFRQNAEKFDEFMLSTIFQPDPKS